MGQYKRKLKKGVRFFYSGQYLGQKYHSRAIYLTKSECAKAERERIGEIDEDQRNPKQDISLVELFTHRLSYLQLTRNQEYFRDNKRLCKQMKKEWGNIQASQVTKKMIADLILKEIKRCRKNKLGNARPNQLLKVAKASFSYADKKLGLEIKNPCTGIEKLPEDDKVKFIPTEEMILAVKAKCNQAQQELIEFCYQTGARINEAIALGYEDVHKDHVVLYTRKSRNSNRVPRFVPRPDFLKPGGEGSVFKTWDTYPRFLEKKVKSLNQPINKLARLLAFAVLSAQSCANINIIKNNNNNMNHAEIIKCIGGYLLTVGVHKIIITEDSFLDLSNSIDEIRNGEISESEEEPKKKKQIKKANKNKPWSRKFDKCVSCGSIEHKHKTMGYCIKCYSPMKIKELKNKSINKPIGKKYHCENCNREFYSDQNYLDVRCQCGSKSLLTLK